MREPCGIQRRMRGTSAEQKRNPHDRGTRDPLATFTTTKAAAGTSVAFPRCGKRLQRRGPRLVGKSDEYRRHARACLEMASAISDPRARASLLQMAQVWFRLADRMPANAKDESHQVEG